MAQQAFRKRYYINLTYSAYTDLQAIMKQVGAAQGTEGVILDDYLKLLVKELKAAKPTTFNEAMIVVNSTLACSLDKQLKL